MKNLEKIPVSTYLLMSKIKILKLLLDIIIITIILLMKRQPLNSLGVHHYTIGLLPNILNSTGKLEECRLRKKITYLLKFVNRNKKLNTKLN